ncbi:MAG: thioredoxin family protein [Bacteroidales bacterium]|nr:thioredoxin family protein [Bacteroidales bacterium]
MKARLLMTAVLAALLTLPCIDLNAQSNQRKPVYDDSLDPLEQIEKAVVQAHNSGKFLICQVGGNWCPWCLLFADFISQDEEIMNFINENFVYIHVNNQLKNAEGKNVPCTAAMARLGNPGRFGYPVFVVLDSDDKVLHFQDSSYLEEGRGYNKSKVMRFFKNWTPAAVNGAK